MTTSITGQGITAYKTPDDVLSSESKNAVQNKVIDGELSDVKNAISELDASKAPAIIKTASGDIASFADGADGMQIRKIVGTIVTAEGGSGWTGANIIRTGLNLLTTSPIRRISRATINTSTSKIASSNYRDILVFAIPKGLLYEQHNAPEECFCGFSNNPNLVIGDSIEASWTFRYSSNQTYNNSEYSYIYADAIINEGNPRQSISLSANRSVLPLSIQTTFPINWQTEAGTILNGTVTLNEDGSADVVNSGTEDTYHLTAVGSLSTYYGTNNVWIDTGAITECTYPADTKLYIDGLTEPDEDMIADDLIASGKYFTVNNQLYLSTAQIAAGAQIIPGSNCTATSITEALNALNT